MKIPIKLWAETENGSALTDTDSLFAKKGTLLRELIEGFGYSAAAFLLGYATPGILTVPSWPLAAIWHPLF